MNWGTLIAGKTAAGVQKSILVDSAGRAILSKNIPALTTTERNALTGVAAGAHIYNTTTGQGEIWTGAEWLADGKTYTDAALAGYLAKTGGIMTGSILFGANNLYDIGAAAATARNIFVGTVIYTVDQVLSGSVYGSGAANLGIYTNPADKSGTAHNLSLYVLDTSVSKAHLEVFRATPNTTSPWVSFPYKVGMGKLTEPSTMLDIVGALTITPITGNRGLCIYGDNEGRGFQLLGNDWNGISTGTGLFVDFGAGSGNTFVKLQSLQSGSAAGGTLALQSGGGSVLIGATAAYGAFNESLEVNHSAGDYGGISLNTWDDDSCGGLNFRRSKATTTGTHTLVTTGQGLGIIQAYGSDGAIWVKSSYIYFSTIGTPAANVMPGSIAFRTASLTGVDTLVMSLTAAKVMVGAGIPVLIGATAAYGRLGQLLEVNTISNYGGIALNSWDDSNGTGALIDFNKSGSDTIGTYVAVEADEFLGYLNFRGVGAAADATFTNSCYIVGKATGTIGAARVPGLLEFHIMSDVASPADVIMLSMKDTEFMVKTTVANQLTSTARLTITGALATAVATWANVTHSGFVLTASQKINPVSGYAGFSVVSTALTLGSAGSIIAPYCDMGNALDDATRDALAGNLDGAIAIDNTGVAATFRIWCRVGGAWKSAIIA